MNTQERLEIINSMYLNRYTYKEIADVLKISRQRVHQVHTGYNSHKIGIVDVSVELLNNLYAGYTQIAVNKDSFSGGRERIREIVRIRDSHTCQNKNCLKVWVNGERRFDVHHLDENMLGKTRIKGIIKYDKENMDKLVTLCHKCHFMWHRDRGLFV